MGGRVKRYIFKIINIVIVPCVDFPQVMHPDFTSKSLFWPKLIFLGPQDQPNGKRFDSRLDNRLTPAQQIVPHQVLLLGKHGHHDESVQVYSLAKHPEVITAKQVEMDEEGHFTACLRSKKNPKTVGAKVLEGHYTSGVATT